MWPLSCSIWADLTNASKVLVCHLCIFWCNETFASSWLYFDSLHRGAKDCDPIGRFGVSNSESVMWEHFLGRNKLGWNRKSRFRWSESFPSEQLLHLSPWRGRERERVCNTFRRRIGHWSFFTSLVIFWSCRNSFGDTLIPSIIGFCEGELTSSLYRTKMAAWVQLMLYTNYQPRIEIWSFNQSVEE